MSVPSQQRRLAASWVLPVGLAALAGAIGFVATWTQSPVFLTQAQIITMSSPGDIDPRASLLTKNAATPTTIIGGLFTSRSTIQHLSRKLKLSEQDVEQRYFVSPDTASGIVGISLQLTDRQLAETALNDLFAFVRNLEMQSSQSVSAVSARQLATAVQSRTKEYEAAQDEFAELLRSKRTPFNGEIKTVAEFSRSLEDLKGELEGTDALLAEVRQSLSLGLSNPDWPKGKFDEQVSSHLEMLRQKVVEAQTTYDGLKEQLGPASPELAVAFADLAAAKSVYARELNQAKLAVRKGFERDLIRLESQRKVLEFQITAKSRIVENAPRESSAVSNAVRNLNQKRVMLNELRTAYELAKVEAEATRVRWSVLSVPGSEDRPINKRYVRTPLTSAAVGLLIGLLFVRLRGRRDEVAS